MREMVGGCCVCSDDRGWSENPLVYCDGQSCNVAVHQACYGIVTVPTGPWYCCKCESQERTTKVKCELCPSRYGALKRTDNQGWAHVVCALYIPEVRFGNVSTMEPIQLHLIPSERFNKVCYICEEKGKPGSANVGACMQCNKVGCKQQFHVTCAQSLGLLCEEAGNYLDNVKYCGYCQHHYSKLKKGGNVKTIPPYKPVNDSQNSDSNSEKEADLAQKSSPPSAAGKRKSTSGNKNNSGKASSSGKAVSQPKTGHSNNKGPAEKRVVTSKSAKVEEQLLPATTADSKTDIKKETVKSEQSVSEPDKESKDLKSGRNKRKGSSANSRAPTPVLSEFSVVVSASNISDSTSNSVQTSTGTIVSPEKKNFGDSEKLKRQKIETTQSIISNQLVIALTSISTARLNSSSTSTTAVTEPIVQSEVTPTTVSSTSIIQTSQAQQPHPQHPSLVVSVPLAGTSLSPHHSLVGNSSNSLTVMPFTVASGGDSKTVATPTSSGSERATPIGNTDNFMMPSSNSNQGLLSSEMSGGGLKITYEKQPDLMNTEVDMELELDNPSTNSTIQEMPAKRTRSQSTEKSDRSTRNRKRSSLGSNSNGHPMQALMSTSLPAMLPKRPSRAHHSSPPPASPVQVQSQPPGAFAAISQERIKDSPPSSPSSESQGASSSNGLVRGHSKGRKSAPAAVHVIQGMSKEDKKEVKIFQNGVAAPHMLGNQLNPTSNMHQKMTDHLSNELEAHSIYHSNDSSPNLMGPQMHHRVIQSARASSTGSSTASGGSGLSSMLGGAIPQTLEQLLERQWEQGSQFLMEQAQHFDIASLLTCLHELRAENLRLEDHVTSLIQRRDHLLAVNARLVNPLIGQHAVAPPQISHTVNNIHPSISISQADMSRTSRHSSTAYDRYPQASLSVPVENGLPPDAYPSNPHRDSVGSGQPSPTVRHSPATPSYPNNGLLRQCPDPGSRSMPGRSQPYPLYDRPGSSHSHSSSSSQQMVIRRDRDRDQDMFGHGPQPS
ncbi:unnamed protein product [Ceutorhynchus assimilis]|uniref:Protein AF-10 n=1 Tax=Ceutorhynchus assimilis TaxID=467358 RepID=A0A9P0DE15_9CUCU|nr:unnamed protein product [Ceutorhynchus assimilis]